MKHLEVGQKYLATRRILNSLLGVLSGDETLRLVPDILLPGYIKASIPIIVFNTSNMTKLNGKSGKKGKKGPCVHKKKFPKAHLFTTCCSIKNCKSGLLCTVSNFTYCPRHRKVILNRNKRHRQEENAPKLYSKTDRLAYFTRSISSCLYVIYAHKS